LDNRYSLADPSIPEQLFNRVEDNWRPLLAIADVIGGLWPERLRAIAVKIAELEAGEDPSQGTQLLHDIKEILGSRDWITSNILIDRLTAKAWVMNGKKLAAMLKPYGVEPRQMRRGDRVERGYLAADFEDAFSRYVPDVPDVPATTAPKKEQPLSEGPVAAGTSGTSGTRFLRRI
jgi:hypothetical protein